MKIVFLHPDFGIGGAERLVLDSALAMRKKGHKVCIITNQFSEDHCFEELKDFKDDLNVVASVLPRTIFGGCYALCAYIRFCIAAFYACRTHCDADLVFCDQISAPLPILRLFGNGAPILFYCHYPDLLLSIKRDTFLKRLYRFVIDNIEAWTMGWADQILVNSNFTNCVVHETFPSLVSRHVLVLYPSINGNFFDNTLKTFKDGINEVVKSLGVDLVDLLKRDETITFLSVNRFERKKNIDLAIKAFALMIEKISPENAKRCILLIAGGYDPLNLENIEHFEELVKLSEELDITNYVKFVKSPNDNVKIWLMSNARLVIYTPIGEHFGIVPIEAMFLSTPVLAVNNGGPTETIIDKTTGFLCSPDKEAFAESMELAMNEPKVMKEMGTLGREIVEKYFSFDSFSDKLDSIVTNMISKKNSANELVNNKND